MNFHHYVTYKTLLHNALTCAPCHTSHTRRDIHTSTHAYIAPHFCSRRPREHIGMLIFTFMCGSFLYGCTCTNAMPVCTYMYAMFSCSQGHCPQPGPASLTSQKALVTRTLFSAALPWNRYPGAMIVGETVWSPLSCAGDTGLGQTLSNPQREGCVCAAGEEGIRL